MNTVKVALGVVLAGALVMVGVGTPPEVAAQPQGPTVSIANVPLPVTGTVADLGQDPRLIVNLRFVNNEAARRINPATGFAGDIFEVPAGYAFVLTDIRGNAAFCQPGSSVLLLLLHNGTTGAVSDRITTTCNGTGDANYERHNTTGLIFAAGSRIVSALSPTVAANHFAFGQGYLVPAD
jgi:uncharacterized protein YcgI (DUF1989 family)